MDVVDDDFGGTSGREWDGAENACEGLGRGDLAFLVDSLHRARGKVGADERETAGEVARDGVDDGELREELVWVREAREEDAIGSTDVGGVLDEKVGIVVLKVSPHNHSLLGVVEASFDKETVNEALGLRAGEDDGTVHGGRAGGQSKGEGSW